MTQDQSLTSFHGTDGFQVSAPGKVILCGEHAVVYGKSAIACSLGLETTASVTKSDSLTLIMDNFNFKTYWKMDEFKEFFIVNNNFQVDQTQLQIIKDNWSFSTDLVSKSVSTFLYLWLSIRNKSDGLILSINSKLPIGGGLGSSASL